MSLTANFTTSQTYGIPNSINFLDTSTGTDNTITSRRIYLKTAANTYLVEKDTTTDYEVWNYSDATITLDVLEKDYALQVTVEWLNSSNAVIYTKTYDALGFTLYNETFDYQLTQILSGNPLIINDNNFFPNKSELRTNIDGGNQAIFFATDLFSAQQCYDRATGLRLGSQYYFNANG
jgi:hypothetical protein